MKEVDSSFYISTWIVQGKEVVLKTDFHLAGKPIFNADVRLDKVSYQLPRDQHPNTLLPTDTRASCTNYGGKCHTCSFAGTTHSLDDEPRVIILGDEHITPLVGNSKDCLLVWRIAGGSLAQFKALMNAQKDMGLKLKQGSIVVVCLVTHLMRVGYEGFWEEWKNFKDWARNHHGLTATIAIPPFPAGYKHSQIAAARRLFARMQFEHFGEVSQPDNLRYSLWKCYQEVADKIVGATIEEFSASPVKVGGGQEAFYLACEGKFMTGCRNSADWDDGTPAGVERLFFTKLITLVKKIKPDTNLMVPDEASILAGLNKEYNPLKEHEGKTIFLMGSSHMSRTSKKLLDLAVPAGVEVVPLCKGGDFLDYFIKNPELLSALGKSTKNDVLFLNCLGNIMLNKDRKREDKDGWHLTNPRMLTDQEFEETVVDLNNALTNIKTTFQGRVVVMGPYPRHLKDCCVQPSHWIRDDEKKKVDMVTYTDVFTDMVYRSANFPKGFFFAGYKEVLGKKFTIDMLEDRVHLKQQYYKQAANYCFQWLNKKHPMPGKSPEKSPPPLSTELNAAKIATVPKAYVVREPEDPDNIEEEVFIDDESAEAVVNFIKKRKESQTKAKQASSKSASNEAAMETDAQGGENAANSRDPADKTPTNSSSSEDDNA